MPSDYEAICMDNIRRRGDEFDDIGRLISEQLYSDRTHFIYELLQNAEDALERRKENNPGSSLPTSVKFTLYEDRLEFRHFGEEFNTDDVEGISDVLKGTKTGDKSQIGKFGIGFKSVYAFTSTPKIHSGDEHFVIERYIRPRSADRIPKIIDGETVFIFPFNHKDLSKEQAFQLIEEKLKKIGSRILLFLRNITEIEWKIEDQDEGLYLKESKQQGRFAQKVTVIGQHGNEDEEEEWLVFERHLDVTNASYESFVEIAFRLNDDESSNKQTIQKIKRSPLFVYFPTKLETLLGFLVQGPYDTTASRSDIEDNEWNNSLIKETAVLLTKQVLPALKKMGLLTVSLLEALPIRMDDFPEDDMFYPIVVAVHDALMNQELLPTDDGTFTFAMNAKIADGADLRDILSPKQLGALHEVDWEQKWLSREITERRTPDLRKYLMEELGIAEIDRESFARRISEYFLAEQSDDWFVLYYRYLSSHELLWRSPRWTGDTKGILRAKPILRLQDDSQVVPFRSDGTTPNAYLPPPEETDFPVVKREIVDNEQAAEFLRRLGLSEPDVFDDIVERVLPKYSKGDVSSISQNEHAADIQKILRALTSDSEAGKKKVVRAAKQTPFLRAVDPVGNLAFKKPGDVYQKSQDLRLYFSGSTDVWFLSEETLATTTDTSVLSELGVAPLPRRVLYSDGLPPGVSEYSTRGETIENYDLHGLDDFLQSLEDDQGFEDKKRAALVLWGYLKEHLEHDPRFFKGSYEWFYRTNRSKSFDSQMLTRLRDTKWIPTQDGSMEKPGTITTDKLLDEFQGVNELIEVLGINQGVGLGVLSEEDQKREHADMLGVSLEDIELLKRHHEEFEQWKAGLEKPALPTRSSANPERRQELLAKQINDAPVKKYEPRNRSVRPTRGTVDPVLWLRNQYTNDADQMICQICKEEMPFRKLDREYYFEAVEALSRDYFPKEHEAQYLALCPLCAAMYKEFVKGDEGARAMESFKNTLINSEQLEIFIQLGELDTSIWFVESHFLDIRTIIEVQE